MQIVLFPMIHNHTGRETVCCWKPMTWQDLWYVVDCGDFNTHLVRLQHAHALRQPSFSHCHGQTWHGNSRHTGIILLNTRPLLHHSPTSPSDGYLHSKVRRPVVLSLRVNQKVSYPFLPTAHLCTDILACFSPRHRRDKMSTPREKAEHTHTHARRENTHSGVFPPISKCLLNPS